LVTLKAMDLPLQQRRPWCVFLWWKLRVTPLDLLLLQLLVVCGPASLWEKLRAKAMRRYRLTPLSFLLSCVPDVSSALALAIGQDSATDLAQYKVPRTQQQRSEYKFL